VCHLIKNQRKDKIWLRMEGDTDETEQLQERKDEKKEDSLQPKSLASQPNVGVTQLWLHGSTKGGFADLTKKIYEQGQGQQPAASVNINAS